MGGLIRKAGGATLVGSISAPTVLKPLSYWTDQVITKGFVIDASQYIQPVKTATTGLTAAQLVPYAQDAGMALLDAAIQALTESISSQLSVNQYYRGGITVVFPAGIIPLAQTNTLTSGRVRFLGHGVETTFMKVGGDYGDCLHFLDRILVGGQYVKGCTELRDFSVIDLTTTTHGGLVIADTLEYASVQNLRLYNGFENLVVIGCNNTRFRTCVLGSDANFSGGNFRPGSTYVSLRTAYNGDIEFYDCTMAGADTNNRLTHDVILIQSADVVSFFGGEYGCVKRATIHMNNTPGLPCQVVRGVGMNLDGGVACHILADGSTSGAFGGGSVFDSQFYDADLNFINLASNFYGAKFRMSATGAGAEAVVCHGTECSFEGQIRGCCNTISKQNQFSAFWVAGVGNTVRNMDCSPSISNAPTQGGTPYSLAYGVEMGLGNYGCAVQSSVFLPGASAFGGVSYNDGSFDTTGAFTAGGAPNVCQNSSAPRTTPTVVT